MRDILHVIWWLISKIPSYWFGESSNASLSASWNRWGWILLRKILYALRFWFESCWSLWLCSLSREWLIWHILSLYRMQLKPERYFVWQEVTYLSLRKLRGLSCKLPCSDIFVLPYFRLVTCWSLMDPKCSWTIKLFVAIQTFAGHTFIVETLATQMATGLTCTIGVTSSIIL